MKNMEYRLLEISLVVLVAVFVLNLHADTFSTELPVGTDNSECLPHEAVAFYRDGVLVAEEPTTEQPLVDSNFVVQESVDIPPEAVVINFDDLHRPKMFSNTIRLVDEYESLGVLAGC